MPNAADAIERMIELSRTIGNIETDVKHTRRSVDVIETKVDHLTETSIRNEESLKAAQKKIDIMHPHVEDYRKLKQRGIGILTAASMFFGAVGAFLSKVIGAMF